MHHRLAINLFDYFAPVAAFLVFVIMVFLISFLFVNFFLINDKDDLTVFEKYGARHLGIRLGPHSLAQIRERMPSMPMPIKRGKLPAESGAVSQRVAPKSEQQKSQNEKEKNNNKFEEFEMKEPSRENIT